MRRKYLCVYIGLKLTSFMLTSTCRSIEGSNITPPSFLLPKFSMLVPSLISLKLYMITFKFLVTLVEQYIRFPYNSQIFSEPIMTYPSPDNLKDESFSCNLLYDCSSLYDDVASGGGAAIAADVIQSVL